MEKLLQIQQSLKAPKSSDNRFGGYKYRSAEQILQAVKPLLEETHTVLTLTDGVQQVGNRVYIMALVALKDAETGDIIDTATAFAREDESLKGMTQSQITGSASSYARKYALSGLFAIDNTDDPDALNNGNITMMTPAQEKLLNDLHIDWGKALEYLELESIDQITEAQAQAMITAKLKKEGKNA